MRLWKGLLTGALALTLAIPACAVPSQALTAQQRQEDLDVLYDTLERAHPNLFANTQEAEFLAWKEEMTKRLDTVDDQTFFIDLQRLTAMAGDSHTTLSLNSQARLMRAYPMSLVWRDGRWYLSAAPAEMADKLGQEVLSAAGQPMDHVADAFGLILSADNPVKLRRQYRQSCNVADFYEYTGLVDAGAPLVLTLADGTALSLEPVSMEALGQLEIAQLGRDLPLPITAEQDRNYLAFSLNDSTFYIQYNSCAEDPELPMETFAAQVQAELERGGYSRVIVDLRGNGGGSDGVIWPLLEVLRQEMDQGTELAVLIGETTFSSAIINAVELQEMGGVLVGDAASGSVDHFGSVSGFRLPNSGIQVGVSRKYIDLGTLLDADAGRGVEPLEPDVTVRQTMEDTLRGKDTAVEWLLANPRRLEQREYPDAPLTRGRFAALLWRQAGSPAAEGSAFSDTLGIEWYLPALSWAAERGVIAGVGDGSFQAVRPVTRQEAAVMLERFAGLTEEAGTPPSDWEEISPWARQAVSRAVAAGLMETADGAFRPQSTLTRSEGEAIAAKLSQ